MLTRKPVGTKLLSIFPGWARIVRWTWEALVCALWARAALFGVRSPFPCAGFAAGLGAGCQPLAMLAGACLGAPWERIGWRAAYAPVGCALVWGAHALMGVLPRLPIVTRILWRARGAMRGRDARIAIEACLGALVSAAIFAMGESYDLLVGLANACIALAVAPVLIGFMGLRWKRTTLMPDERIALVLGVSVLLLGVKQSPMAVLATPMAALVTLFASSIGAAYGAGMGVLAGTVLAFAGEDPFIGASLGLCGMIAGAAARFGRLWATLGFLFGNTVTLTFGAGYAYGAMHPLYAAGVGTLFCGAPGALLEKLETWFRPRFAGCDPDRLAGRVCRTTEKRLSALKSVFEELENHCGTPSPTPDEHMHIAQMRRALCSGCEDYPACWSEGNGNAGRLLCGFLLDAMRGQVPDADAIPPEIHKRCRRAAQIPRRLGALLSDFERRRRAALERRSTGEILGGHYRQAALILNELGERIARPMTVDAPMAVEALAALERDGFAVGDVLALRGDRLELVARLRDARWDRDTAMRAAKCLALALGVPLRPELITDSHDTELRFLEAPTYSAIVGYACRARSADMPSGDSHLISGMPGARILLALSDGMGSGARAQRESGETVRLLKRFMLADMEPTIALDTINRLLLMQNGDDMYATCDIALLDLGAGSAQFIKLGACHSYVLRKRALIMVEGGRLPLGILESIAPATRTVALRPGDTIVLFSDGLADTTSDADTAWIEDALRRARGDTPPRTLCEQLIAAAAARPGIHDDMTVLAARIVETDLYNMA